MKILMHEIALSWQFLFPDMMSISEELLENIPMPGTTTIADIFFY